MSSVYINAQLVSACKWLSLTNNCCSFCHKGNQLFWRVYRCPVHQTLHLPQIKKSIGVRSGEHGGHWTGPPLPILRLGKTLFRYSLTSRTKCAGAPSCWNHNRCLICSGTFSNIFGNMSRIKIMQFPNIFNNFCKTILRQNPSRTPGEGTENLSYLSHNKRVSFYLLYKPSKFVYGIFLHSIYYINHTLWE